jgi:dUTP pyrophosphatase
MSIQIKIKKIDKNVKIPTYAYNDAGMDLYANENFEILAGEIVQIKTGIAMEIPNSFVGLI